VHVIRADVAMVRGDEPAAPTGAMVVICEHRGNRLRGNVARARGFAGSEKSLLFPVIFRDACVERVQLVKHYESTHGVSIALTKNSKLADTRASVACRSFVSDKHVSVVLSLHTARASTCRSPFDRRLNERGRLSI